MPPSPPARQYAAAATAMSLEDLDLWLRQRAEAHPPPLATSLSMLDGFVSAVVAGPVSMDPRRWIRPLLGIGADAFDQGGTPEFAALCAVIVRHNAISDTLPTRPDLYQPIFAKTPAGQVDPAPWAKGFQAAMDMNPKAWARLKRTSPDSLHLLPILASLPDAHGLGRLAPVIGDDPIARAMLGALWRDIPISVNAIRKFWMPFRFKTTTSTRSPKAPRRRGR
jgi:yecA family protein